MGRYEPDIPPYHARMNGEPDVTPPGSGAPGGADGADRADGPGGVDGSGLSEQDRAVLAWERRGWPPAAGTKERVIRERLEMSPTRYYQVLNALLDDPAALAHDPVTVNRLRRLREQRRAQR